MKSFNSLLGTITGLSTLCLLSVSAQANPYAHSYRIAQTVAPLSPDSAEPFSPPPGSSGLFSIDAGKQMMSEASSAVAAQNYPVAIDKYQDSRQLMNQLSNFYQGLASTFGGVDPIVTRSLRSKALETAELRDKSTYQLALVYRTQNQPDKAIPLLIEIVRSQNPSRNLGQRAYRQLLEMGFVDTPYPRTQQTGEAPAPSGEAP